MKSCLPLLKQVQPIPTLTGSLAVDVPFFHHRKDKVVFVIGATGTGKSRLAIDLARHFAGEVVNSDKIQVHRGLDITTNKVTEEECQGVPHHLLGTIDQEANFTSEDFNLHASKAIESIVDRDRVPIVAGGSNSCIESLVRECPEFRVRYECLFLWVDVSLPVLRPFVGKRVDRMVAAGLVDEVQGIFHPDADYSVGIRKAIGVPELDDYFRAEIGGADSTTRAKLKEEGIRKIKMNTEVLAGRQVGKIQRLNRMWSRRMHRIDATEVFFMRQEEEEDGGEAWERAVARPSTALVERFVSGERFSGAAILPEATPLAAVAAASR